MYCVALPIESDVSFVIYRTIDEHLFQGELLEGLLQQKGLWYLGSRYSLCAVLCQVNCFSPTHMHKIRVWHFFGDMSLSL